MTEEEFTAALVGLGLGTIDLQDARSKVIDAHPLREFYYTNKILYDNAQVEADIALQRRMTFDEYKRRKELWDSYMDSLDSPS